ncbi:hypothetical protein [Pannonibacter tanglangensis]|uniref:Capsid assembly protein n=1 Tax=Pannonibacter tanglangensis TaxID=2750084 RepID=A0ABW9ZH02_9HYPH|nr:hypothetical protein [Pannonibacter sp. XCT-34]NBN64133.1 hypothetical protein [Pannonibacter sp. XCT-34]
MENDTAPAAPGAAPAPANQQTQPAAAPWYGDLGDTELKGWAENKKFQSAAEALRSYHSLEKMFGHDRAGRTVVLPGENASQEERDAFFNRLGRPEAPDNYDLGLPGDAPVDPDFQSWFKGVAHKHGLTAAQAKALAADYVPYAAKRGDLSQQEAETLYLQEEAELKKSWGAAYSQKTEQAKAAAKAFGLDETVVGAIEKSAGYAKTMQFFAAIGAKIGELPQMPGVRDPGAMTPHEAEAEIGRLLSDPAWKHAYLNGSKTHEARLNQLYAMKAARG